MMILFKSVVRLAERVSKSSKLKGPGRKSAS